MSQKKEASPIKIGTYTLKEEDQATYLGVTFDKRLTWKTHTLRTEGKARKLAIIRKLAGTTWGADTQESVRGISETRPGVQINSMVSNCKEQTTAIQPLQQRRQANVLLQAEKYKCLPDHPMKENVEGRTMNRIQRSSFTHEVKKLHKD